MAIFIVSKRRWIFVLIIMLGVFLLTTKGSFNTFNIGDFLILAGVFLLGFTNTLSKIAMKNANGEIVASFRLIIGSLFLVMVIPLFLTNAFSAFSSGALFILASGIFMFAAINFFLKGMELSSPNKAAIAMMLQPIFSTGLAYIFLKETLSPIQFAGALAVMIGFYLFTKPDQKPYKMSKTTYQR